MKKLITAVMLTSALSLASISSAFAEEEVGALAAENFSATLTFTSNYMYRGLSFSNDHPAIQGSFDWAYNNFFAGVWGTSLSDQSGSGYELENDFYFGYANSVAGIDWYIMPIYYHFYDNDEDDPAYGNARAEADVFELWLDASYAINDRFSVHSMYAYSPDFFFESGSAHYLKADVTANLPAGFSLNAGFGYQSVAGKVNPGFVAADGWNYTHWDITLTKNIAGFDFSLMYSDTSEDSATDTINTGFFVDTGSSDDTITFTVSRSF